MKYQVTLNGKNYEVDVEKGEAEVLAVTDTVASVPQAPAAQAAPQAAPSSISAGVDPVAAPMPGTILDIKVSEGTSVKKDDVLLILEAMKMENEIVAPRDGIVSGIAVQKSSTVSAGNILLYLK